MKTTFENPVDLNKATETVETEMKQIFQLLCMCKIKANLKVGLEAYLPEPENFEYGFGGGHFWLKQKFADGTISEYRILIVEFEEVKEQVKVTDKSMDELTVGDTFEYEGNIYLIRAGRSCIGCSNMGLPCACLPILCNASDRKDGLSVIFVKL